MFALSDYKTLPVRFYNRPPLGFYKVTTVFYFTDYDTLSGGMAVEIRSASLTTREKPFLRVEVKSTDITQWEPRIGELVEVKYVDSNVTISKSSNLKRLTRFLKIRS